MRAVSLVGPRTVKLPANGATTTRQALQQHPAAGAEVVALRPAARFLPAAFGPECPHEIGRLATRL